MKKILTSPIYGCNQQLLSFGKLLLFLLFLTVGIFPQASPATVPLGTSADFVILAETGISTTGTTNITGDIGVSPAAAAAITGFALIADPSNTFSTSSVVTGKVYAANYANPTPAKLTTAIGDMQTAYTNAAGRLLPDYTELHSGILTGRTLTRGLYKWSTDVLITAGGLTISGTAQDIWIFQIAQNLNVGTGANITLTGGAKASNIFWQVAGQVSLGTTASMQGILLCKTKIVISTGASLYGRAMAHTAVTLDANSVTQPVVETLPSIVSTNPSNNATGVILKQKVSAVFNGKMDSSTFNNASFGIKLGNASVAGSVSYAGLTAVFTPLGNLLSNSVYTATVTNSVKDSAGNQMATNYTWSFATGTAVPVAGSDIEIPGYALEQNFPNPFNPTTRIQYSLEKSTFVLLRVYNLLGNEVATLVSSTQKPGNYSVEFNATEATLHLSSGIYIYRLEAGSFTSTRKLVYMK